MAKRGVEESEAVRTFFEGGLCEGQYWRLVSGEPLYYLRGMATNGMQPKQQQDNVPKSNRLSRRAANSKVVGTSDWVMDVSTPKTWDWVRRRRQGQPIHALWLLWWWPLLAKAGTLLAPLGSQVKSSRTYTKSK